MTASAWLRHRDLPSTAAWLKRRASSRQRWSGTGTTMSASGNSGAAARCSHAANLGASQERSAILKARISFRPRAFVEERRACPVEDGRHAGAVATDRVRGRLDRKRQAAARAAGPADEGDAVPAVGAKPADRTDRRIAGEARRRQYLVDGDRRGGSCQRRQWPHVPTTLHRLRRLLVLPASRPSCHNQQHDPARA